MTEVIAYNIAKDRRTWFDKLTGCKKPVQFSCHDTGSVLLAAEIQNWMHQRKWHGRIGTIHMPRKPRDET
tara:strand:+ start:221 stop:430 length:210 start_codon:yes stop_codon:yes gene_type:complete